MSEPMLTRQQVTQFHENGFLAIESISTPEEIAMMRDLYDRLFERKAGRDVGDHFDLAGTDEDGRTETLPQILNPSRYEPAFTDLVCRRNTLTIARELLGEEVAFQGDHAILKGGGGVATPWHQDEAYWNPEFEYRALSAWIPLQEATIENGCMQFIPGSHLRDIAPHHPIGHDPRVHALELDEPVDVAEAVACPLPPGGATFHSSRTLHYTSENKTSQPRRAYILMFGRPPVRRAEPRVYPWLETRQTAREKRAAASGRKD